MSVKETIKNIIDNCETKSALRKVPVYEKEKKWGFLKENFGWNGLPSKEMGISEEDCFHFTVAPLDNYVEVPQIMNTLENCYKSISLWGSSKYSENIKSYFESNTNTKISIVSDDEINSEENAYILNRKQFEDEMLLVLDFIPEKPVFDASGEEVLCIFAKKLFSDELKTTAYNRDINQNILPVLQANGVNIIKIYTADLPSLNRFKKVLWKNRRWGYFRKINPSLFLHMRHKMWHSEYLETEEKSLINVNKKGYSELIGNGKYINYDNGFRTTAYNSPNAKHDMWVFGPCYIRGNQFKDDETIPSLISKQFSDINVHNLGSTFHTMNYVMRTIDYKPGDFVVIFSSESSKKISGNETFDIIEMKDIMNAIPDLEKHVSDLPEHFDSVVANKISDTLCKKVAEIISNQSTSESVSSLITWGPEHKTVPSRLFIDDAEFLNYIDSVKSQLPPTNGKRGAAVMNCNPFTLGHKFLIQTAASMVDQFIIFVVEENRSYFQFEDRLNMVKAGVADMENVFVFPSGQHIISSTTLPGYFEKEKGKEVLLDASNDLLSFLQIAKELDIDARYVGEEPIDNYTNQYNQNMQNIFKKYDFEFIVIPRREYQDDVISASRVRAAIKENDLETIQKIVPETTFEYLKKLGLIH